MGRIGETEAYQSSIQGTIPEYHGITEMDWCEGTITLYCKVDIHGYVFVRRSHTALPLCHKRNVLM